jgi:hypothetical protein
MQNYEKEAVSELSKTDAETVKSAASEVISLLEDCDSIVKTPKNKRSKSRYPVVYKSPNVKPPHKLSSKLSHVSKNASKVSKDSKGKKKFKKDEHALVMAWRSRTSSPCPSSNSVKSSQFSISSNLSFKEKKQLLKKGAVKHPSIFTMKRVSSMTNSVISDLSSKGSVLDSLVSFNFNNQHE